MPKLEPEWVHRHYNVSNAQGHSPPHLHLLGLQISLLQFMVQLLHYSGWTLLMVAIPLLLKNNV